MLRRTAEEAIAHAVRLGIKPTTVIDVGAAFGDWSEMCHRLLPDASYLMIEPLEEFEPFLAQKAARFENFRYVRAVAASHAECREIHVHPDLTGSSVFEEDEADLVKEQSRLVRATTLDAEVSTAPPLPPPYLVKVDVQGAELEVLKGATEVLQNSEVILLETSLFEFFSGGPQLHDVVIFMKSAGFVVYDMCNLAYRPLDGALAQVDLVFVPETSPLRTTHIYANLAQRRRQNAAMRAVFKRRRKDVMR